MRQDPPVETVTFVFTDIAEPRFAHGDDMEAVTAATELTAAATS